MLLIFSIFHFSLYLLRIRDKAFFIVQSIFTLAILVCTRGERTLYREFPSIAFEWYFRLQDFITYLNAVMLFLFFVYTVTAMMKRKTAMFLCHLLYYMELERSFYQQDPYQISISIFHLYKFLALLIIGRLLYLMMTKSAHVPKMN